MAEVRIATFNLENFDETEPGPNHDATAAHLTPCPLRGGQQLMNRSPKPERYGV